MTNLATDQLAAISRLFSSSIVREMARKGRSPLFARLAAQARLPNLASAQVHEFFDAAFALLRREGYRHEYIYKAAITQNVLLGKHSLRSASMINEFRVGECKADMVILNGTGTVYEVKSERDSLARLERQVEAYSKVFAAVYVIASEDHIDAVIKMVPKDVGVQCLNKRYYISTVRDAVERPERTSASAIFDAIRTGEARAILRAEGISMPAVPNTMLNAALRELFVKLDSVAAHAGMVKTLKKTRNLLPLSTLIDQLPRSLYTAALSIPLRKADHMRLVTAVNASLADAMTWA